jgi:hypothetical protein
MKGEASKCQSFCTTRKKADDDGDDEYEYDDEGTSTRTNTTGKARSQDDYFSDVERIGERLTSALVGEFKIASQWLPKARSCYFCVRGVLQHANLYSMCLGTERRVVRILRIARPPLPSKANLSSVAIRLGSEDMERTTMCGLALLRSFSFSDRTPQLSDKRIDAELIETVHG